MIPLLRLEGAIDANGFELAEYAGLPGEIFAGAKEELDRLHRRELELKRTGRWGTTDLAAYTQEMLGEIDRLVYKESDFSDFTRIEEEFGHVEIGPDRVAVVCRDSSGIYEVEKRLKGRWGSRLGIIALQTAPKTYTLRRTASFAGIDLERAFQQLNLEDPAVDGRPPEKGWGGSDEIGGSPRPDGTALEPEGVGRALEKAYRPRTPWSRLAAVGRSAASALGPALAALGGGALFHVLVGSTNDPEQSLLRMAVAATCALFAAAILSLRASRGRLWLYGSRRPAGRDWLPLLVPAIAGGSALTFFGVEAKGSLGISDPRSLLLPAVVLLLVSAAYEVWFRGLVHGRLLGRFPAQRVASRWFLSVPALVSALLYGAAAALLAWGGLLHQVFQPLPMPPFVAAGSLAFLTGLVLAMVRERSLSLWPGFLAQILGGTVALLLASGIL